MKCTRCNTNNQSPGAEPLCGSCWAKGTSSTMIWPSYGEVFMAIAATGKVCRHCNRKLYALPGDDKNADVCVGCV